MPSPAESVHPDFVLENLLAAQEKTKQVVEQIRAAVTESMTEDDLRVLALGIFADHGVTRHWHRPFIRVGEGTISSFRDPACPDDLVLPGSPFYIDVGPVWHDASSGLDYEGDYGDTYVFGDNPAAAQCAATARTLFAQGQAAWRKGATGVQMYDVVRQGARDAGLELLEEVNGHRIADFPHQLYSKDKLGLTTYVPAGGVWVFEVHVVSRSGGFGAFYEDVLN